VLVRVGKDLTTQFSGQALTDAYLQWFGEHKSELWPLDRYKYIDTDGIYTGSQSVHNPGREGYRYDILHKDTGRPCKQPLMGYRFPKETMDEKLAKGHILFGEDENKIVELKVYAEEYQDKLSSVIELDGRLGAYDLKSDFPVEGKVFSNPKPVRLLPAFFPFLLRRDGDVVLDFFAGSGSTAKAIFEMNSKDLVRRRFILVQLPEPLTPDDRDQKSATQLCDNIRKPRTIAELTKERLRRAGAKIREANPMFSSDLGFRVFKLDSTNIRAWDPDRSNLSETLLDSVDHLKADRTEEDILFELLLKLGLELTVPIEQKTIAGKTAHSVGVGSLFVCLAPEVGRKEIEPLARGIAGWREELSPVGETQVVFRDSAFADDVAKTNITAILKQHGLENVRSL
jgi:adenine-specific DNA-methyltransferase